MRKYLLIAGLIMFLFNYKGFAQGDGEQPQGEIPQEESEEEDYGLHRRPNTLKINALSPFVSSISAFYERGITTNLSAQIGLFYTGYSLTGTSWRGYGITPEVRYYFSDNETFNEGLYVAPFFRYQQLEVIRHIQDAELSSLMNTFGGGVIGGYQLKIVDRIALDAFLGPAFDIGTFRYEEEIENVEFDGGPFSGFNLRAGFAVGYSF